MYCFVLPDGQRRREKHYNLSSILVVSHIKSTGTLRQSVCWYEEEVAVKVWHEPVAKKEFPVIHFIWYQVKPAQKDLSNCQGFSSSPWILRSALCPSPKDHQSITWLYIQTQTKSTHIVHGMCFPNAKEVKTNQNAKLWISCKAFVNTHMQKVVYFSLMTYLILMLSLSGKGTATQIKVKEVSDYIHVKRYWTGWETHFHWSGWPVTL